MKSLRKSERGTSFIMLLVGLVVIAIIGLVAYKVRSNTLSSSNSTPTATVKGPQTIKNRANLKTAKQALQTAPIGSDLDSTQLDSNINSLL